MRIGILTHFYRSLNYGGMLQAYALTKYLNNKGYQAEQISYAFSSESFMPALCGPESEGSFKPTDRWLRIPKRISRSLHYRLITRPCEKYYAGYKSDVIPRRADSFRVFQECVPHSERLYSPESVSDAADQYDCLITGSDQVWNFDWFNPAFFLDFQDHSARRIAYAASAGKTSFSPEELCYLQKTLTRINSLSVRERDLAEKLNQILGKDKVVQTIDPVLLLSSDEWDDIASQRLIKTRYLFCYFLHNDASLCDIAKRYASKHHLKIATIPFPGIEFNEVDKRFGTYRFNEADPADFISLIKYADYVLTDSFHASAFSLIYGKQFVAFPRRDAKSMGSRLLSLMELFGCKERFCQIESDKRLDYIESLSVYASTNRNSFEDMKIASEAFLQKALSE